MLNTSVSFFGQNQENVGEVEKEKEKDNQVKKIAEKEADSDEDGFELVDDTQVHFFIFGFI